MSDERLVSAVGDPRGHDGQWKLMPVDTSGGQCSQCGIIHDPELPHDRQRLPYQYSFYAEHGRWPTWRDAMAHCDEEIQQAWIEALRARGVKL